VTNAFCPLPVYFARVQEATAMVAPALVAVEVLPVDVVDSGDVATAEAGAEVGVEVRVVLFRLH
jgi:hypothetical protein